MPSLKYRPYYRYAPTTSNPLLDELNEEEVERNLRLLVDDLNSNFNETGGLITSSEEGVITLTSDLTEKECDEIVATCLSSLHLLADKISE